MLSVCIIMVKIVGGVCVCVMIIIIAYTIFGFKTSIILISFSIICGIRTSINSISINGFNIICARIIGFGNISMELSAFSELGPSRSAS